MILVTRPQPEATATADLLHQRGHKTVVEPMLEVVPIPCQVSDRVDVALFTSGNGVRYVPQEVVQQQPIVLVVGDATEKLAHERGFNQVVNAQGDVDDLYKLSLQYLKPDQQVVHFAGMINYGHLSERLCKQGFLVSEVLVYEAKACVGLSESTVSQLKQGLITSALFFSPRTAKVFMANAEEQGVIPYLYSLSAYCLSPAVANVFPQDVWKTVIVAEEPNQESLINKIEPVNR